MPICLADKVAYLRGLCGAGDEAIETHFAWVFLLGERALKLRKPVRREMMDYSTLEARRADSEAEVRLNRRLAADIYLGTIALTHLPGRGLGLGGNGEIVDWLVAMRRLDRQLMLDAALERGAADPRTLNRVVDLLSAFYATSPAAITARGEAAQRLTLRLDANREALKALDADGADALHELQRNCLRRLERELDERARRGCIIEAHGDLRPEHILLAEPPAVIDCLEFDRELRILDRAEELCFLELECARSGHADTGRRLLRDCLARLGDDASAGLLDFYRSHRAATRAKIYTWRADEPDGGTPAQWRDRARGYLRIALASARRALDRPPDGGHGTASVPG